MRPKSKLLIFISAFALLLSCGEKKKETDSKEPSVTESKNQKIKLIFDTDANNELDDQFALAYMLFNGDVFDVKGVTVNATRNDKSIQGHYDEAERVMQLCNLKDSLPLLKGAEGNFVEISENFDPNAYDGQDAVDFILEETKIDSIIVVAVGKLTNIALALKKDPTLAKRTKIVWLGSNYPDPGEYNQDNDTTAMNFVLNSKIPFEMVTVRYGKPSGTDAVAVTKTEVNQKLPGLGPKAIEPIEGRHGGTFETFGDYGINLFEHIFDHMGTTDVTPSRPLFDMVALAILKNPTWATSKTISCPVLINNAWVERPNNKRSIILWEHFDRTNIMEDFYNTIERPVLVSSSK